jgi:hypothetical protein
MSEERSWYDDYTKGWTNRCSNSSTSKIFLLFSKSTKGLWDPPNGDQVKIGCDGGSELKMLYLYTPQLLGQEEIYFLMSLLHQKSDISFPQGK